MAKYSMRFDDLIKKPAKPQRPLTYNESLEVKLKAQLSTKTASKFTPIEYAMIEDGHRLEKK
jgi:hypothetical protein